MGPDGRGRQLFDGTGEVHPVEGVLLHPAVVFLALEVFLDAHLTDVLIARGVDLVLQPFPGVLEEVLLDRVEVLGRLRRDGTRQISNVLSNLRGRLVLAVNGRRERFEGLVVGVGDPDVDGAVLRSLQFAGAGDGGGDQQSLGVGPGGLTKPVGDVDSDRGGGFEIFGPGEIVYTVRAGGTSGQNDPRDGDQAYGGENPLTEVFSTKIISIAG
ncbi:hypothetical protein ABZY32_25865 [Nocardiopsis alba]|uniref:hypothetical protein n=1 Tax=Nocardiopsis alba TaxID=53437 RepID=UPI0033BE8E22